MNVFRARRTLIWGVLSILLGGALLLSFSLSGGAIGKAKSDAEQRAEDYTNTVLYKAVTPGLVDRPITGRDYGEILIDVQAGILSDDDVVRVRLWNISGVLVFSSDQRDRLGQEAGFDGLLRRVADGATISDVTGARVAPQPGLAGSNEQLFKSYVPVQLGDQVSVSAVAEIDQRYAAIQASARTVWRPVQIALGVALLAGVAMLVLSIRAAGTHAGSSAAGDPRAAERARALERQLRDVERRAKDAEERAGALEKAKASVEHQLASSERNLRDTLAASKTNERDVAPPEELAAALRRVREAETERDRLATEIERLNIAMSESGATHARTAELQSRLAELEALGSGADARAAEAEARARDAERRLAEAEQRSKTAVDRAQGDLDGISIRLSETQSALAQATDRVGTLEAEVERLEQARADAAMELQRAGLATGERDQEVQRLRDAIAERDQQLEQLHRSQAERDGELERLRSGLGARAGEIEQVRAEAVAKNAELEQLRAEAVAKNAELDALRADTASKASDLERLLAEAAARTAELEELRTSAGSRVDEIEQARAAVISKDEELVQVRGTLSGKDSELVRLRAELEQASAQAQAAAAQAATGGPDVEELRNRVAELEELRRTEVADTQRAHELLANTQLELAQGKRRIEELEERARAIAAATVDRSSAYAGTHIVGESNGELAEHDARRRADQGVAADAGGPPVFAPPDEATIDSRLSAFRKRRAAPRIENTPPPSEQWQPPATAESPREDERPDPTPEISPEGLSLRERLTRTAAARHRVTTPTERPDD